MLDQSYLVQTNSKLTNLTSWYHPTEPAAKYRNCSFTTCTATSRVAINDVIGNYCYLNLKQKPNWIIISI